MSKFDKINNFMDKLIRLLVNTLLLFFSIYGIAQNVVGIENAPPIWLNAFWLLGFVGGTMRRD
jgi:hypothetical protein